VDSTRGGAVDMPEGYGDEELDEDSGLPDEQGDED
jgi:hypothetical protein